jgi:hypothetical protein
LAKKVKNRKNRGRHQNSSQKPPSRNRNTSHFLQFAKKLFSSILFWLLTCISIIGFIFLVYPRISVYPGESLNHSNPFETPFIIKNDGYLPINNILYHLNVTDSKIGNLTLRGELIKGEIQKIHKLSANSTSTVIIRNVISMPPNIVRAAEIRISLEYKPFILPLQFGPKDFCFNNEIKSNGEYVWFPISCK